MIVSTRAPRKCTHHLLLPPHFTLHPQWVLSLCLHINFIPNTLWKIFQKQKHYRESAKNYTWLLLTISKWFIGHLLRKSFCLPVKMPLEIVYLNQFKKVAITNFSTRILKIRKKKTIASTNFKKKRKTSRLKNIPW